MKTTIFVSLLILSGCKSNGLDKILYGGQSDAPKSDGIRHEPYAVFDLEDANGKQYEVHWKGNILNGLDFTAKQLAQVNIPIFES